MNRFSARYIHYFPDPHFQKTLDQQTYTVSEFKRQFANFNKVIPNVSTL